ncbi:MAG: NTP transferase domain-containing protein, partial [Luteimonas sp.]
MQASHESIAVFPSVTLGILAGGQATRLGGIEKAWLQSDGIPHVLRLRDVFATQVKAIAVSANRNLSRYTQHGLQTVPDHIADVGPLAGVDALLAMCQTPWLLTLPVDIVAVPADLLERLAANGQGTFAQDDDGPQPLIALWPVAKTRGAIARALACNAHAV